MERLLTSQTVRSGKPSLQSVTRWRANSYTIGPFVPSETCRRYQREAGRRAATAATGHGAVSGTTHLVRRAAYASVNHASGRNNRLSTRAYPWREAYPANTPT